MDNIAGWLASITWPLVSRVFASLGFGTVTYVGANEALGGALNAAKAGFLGLTGDVLQLLVLAGFFDAMSIMSGGLIAGLSWLVMKKFALQTTGAGA
jgi:hypothetical protein